MLNEDHTFGLESLDTTQQQAIFFFKLASKQFLACTTQSTQAETPTAHKTAHYGPKEPMPQPRDPSQPIIQHRPTLPSIHGPSAHTTKGPARFPDRKIPTGSRRVSCTQPPCISLASSPVSFRSRPRAPDSACLSPPTRRCGARQSRVSSPRRRSTPTGHVEARCVRIVDSSLPHLAIGWDPVVVWCRLVVFFFRSRGF